MSDVGVDHGFGSYFRDKFSANAYTGGIGVGQFTATAAGVTTVSDAAITSTAKVIVFPANGPAGLLVKSKSCFVDTIGTGSFVFNCSATGSGAPAGTEIFAYMFLTES